MSEEFEDINSRLPDLSAAIAQRIAGNTVKTSVPSGAVDPYELMLKKKTETSTSIDPSTIQKWPEEDIKKLELYCQRMGITGFNCGRMHPIAALAMLKSKFGEDFTDIPLEERVPAGYQKMGTPSQYGPNFPYSKAITKRKILHD